jgi:hypothetical protein
VGLSGCASRSSPRIRTCRRLRICSWTGDSVYLHRSSTTPPYALIARRADGRLVGIRLTGVFNYAGGTFHWAGTTWTDDDLVAIYRGITFTP